VTVPITLDCVSPPPTIRNHWKRSGNTTATGTKINSDSSLVASYRLPGERIDIFNLDDGTLLSSLDINALNISHDFSWGPDGKLLFTRGPWRSEILIVDGTTGNIVNTFDSNRENLRELLWQPNGNLIFGHYSAGADTPQTIIWDSATGEVVKQIDNMSHAIFSRDGNIFASTWNRTIYVFSSSTLEIISEITDSLPDSFFGLTLNKDGRKIALFGRDDYNYDNYYLLDVMTKSVLVRTRLPDFSDSGFIAGSLYWVNDNIVANIYNDGIDFLSAHSGKIISQSRPFATVSQGYGFLSLSPNGKYIVTNGDFPLHVAAVLIP
jgi:dipeptidyl aminopeptidase/acylaminoacyl peptidase